MNRHHQGGQHVSIHYTAEDWRKYCYAKAIHRLDRTDGETRPNLHPVAAANLRWSLDEAMHRWVFLGMFFDDHHGADAFYRRRPSIPMLRRTTAP
jgi:hypothetical protein